MKAAKHFDRTANCPARLPSGAAEADAKTYNHRADDRAKRG
jgi:hypothetical protein